MRKSGAEPRQHTVHAAVPEGAAAGDPEGQLESRGGRDAAAVRGTVRRARLGYGGEVHSGTQQQQVSRAVYELHRTQRAEGKLDARGRQHDPAAAGAVEEQVGGDREGRDGEGVRGRR